MDPNVTGKQVLEQRVINIDEATDNRNNIPGFKQTTNFHPNYAFQKESKSKKKNLISRFFSDLSRLGMTYDDDVIANMRALPADKSLLDKETQQTTADIFAQLQSSWKNKSNKDKDFYEKDYQAKREVLRKLALQPELEDILDTFTNEAIVYDTNLTYFAEPFVDPKDYSEFNKKTVEKISNCINKNYAYLYKMLDWKYRAWDDFKRFLVEGILSWEIVYDSLENPTKIIGLVPLDPATLTKKFENNKTYWIQFKGIVGKERKLLDSQIIYIQYQDTQSVCRTSYLERLIRPFNIYRIIEQAQIIWTVTNAQYKMAFTIPIKGLGKTLGTQTLMTSMNKYKEDIKFISDSGELTINGQVTQPFNKEYWFAESDSGKPEIEILGGEGPEINDGDQLKYFKNQLYKVSKIPLNRFDQENSETWFGSDATSVMRCEVDFSRFVTRLRNIFSMIVLKPLAIWVALEIPELKDNRDFLNSIALQYKTYNPFEEMIEIELMQKRVDFIQTMKDSMVDMDLEGNEIKFFSSRFLVEKYLKLSDADIKLNEKYKQQEIEDLHLAGGEDAGQQPGLNKI